MISNNAYFKYLSTRSFLGYFYRKYLLYPKLESKLVGKILDVGIDPETVKYCKGKGFSVKLMRVDKIPFGDASFNSVVLDNVLEHIADPKPLLLEIFRVLDSKGILLVGVPGVRGFRADSDHKIFYCNEHLKSTLAEVGFECKEIFDMPFQFKFMSKFIKAYCIYGVFIKKTI
jgi:SAM-dependent methyltransferase